MCFTRALGMGDRARSDIPRTSLPEAPSEKECTAHRALGRCPVPHATRKKPGAFCSMPVICPHRTCLPSSAGGGPFGVVPDCPSAGVPEMPPKMPPQVVVPPGSLCCLFHSCLKGVAKQSRFQWCSLEMAGRARLVCSASIDPSRRSGPPGLCAVLIAYLQASDSKTPRS